MVPVGCCAFSPPDDPHSMGENTSSAVASGKRGQDLLLEHGKVVDRPIDLRPHPHHTQFDIDRTTRALDSSLMVAVYGTLVALYGFSRCFRDGNRSDPCGLCTLEFRRFR